MLFDQHHDFSVCFSLKLYGSFTFTKEQRSRTIFVFGDSKTNVTHNGTMEPLLGSVHDIEKTGKRVLHGRMYKDASKAN